MLFVILAVWVLFNTFTFNSRQVKIAPVELMKVSDSTRFRLSKAISLPTISNANPALFDSASFDGFKEFIKHSYPLTDSLLDVTYINEYSMSFKWEGSDPSLKPMILMGLHDVVPVPEENVS